MTFPGVDATGYTLTEIVPLGFEPTTLPIRDFDVESRQEFAWAPGASDVDPLDPDDPREEIVVGDQLIFGNTVRGSIHGFKYEDVNGNGIYEPNQGDVPQAGVAFNLTGVDGQGNPVDRVEVTDEFGEFWFRGLWPSVEGSVTFPGVDATGYTLTEIVPLGFEPTTLPIRDFDVESRQEFAWAPGASDVDPLDPDDPREEIVVGDQLIFGNTVRGSIHGFKYEDVNGNGIYEPNQGDVPQAGVAFNLTGVDGQGNPVDRVEVTDEFGEFWFRGLWPSVEGSVTFPGVDATGYTLTEIVPLGFEPTTLPIRDFDVESRQEFAWAPGASDVDPLDPDDPREEIVVGDQLIFGNTVRGSIHGFKYEDVNGNGIYEPNQGDVPQAGVAFNLTGVDGQGNPVDRVEVTDEFGEFWFRGLWPSVEGSVTFPGVDATGYTLTEIVPLGFEPTTLPIRDFDVESRQEFAWAPGASDVDPLDPDDPRFEIVVGDELIFGNTVRGSIHGFKFEDIDGDGIYDPDLGDVPQVQVLHSP